MEEGRLLQREVVTEWGRKLWLGLLSKNQWSQALDIFSHCKTHLLLLQISISPPFVFYHTQACLLPLTTVSVLPCQKLNIYYVLVFDSPLIHTIMQSAPGHIVHSCNPQQAYPTHPLQLWWHSMYFHLSTVFCMNSFVFVAILVVQTMTMVRVSFAYAASLGRKTA